MAIFGAFNSKIPPKTRHPQLESPTPKAKLWTRRHSELENKIPLPFDTKQNLSIAFFFLDLASLRAEATWVTISSSSWQVRNGFQGISVVKSSWVHLGWNFLPARVFSWKMWHPCHDLFEQCLKKRYRQSHLYCFTCLWKSGKPRRSWWEKPNTIQNARYVRK